MEGNELENIVLAKFYFLRVLVGPPTAIVEFRLRLHFSLISAPLENRFFWENKTTHFFSPQLEE